MVGMVDPKWSKELEGNLIGDLKKINWYSSKSEINTMVNESKEN